MTMHSLHPDSHEHGLADDCPRCAEHAEHPIRTLDRENLRRIMALAISDNRLAGEATYTDQVAAAKVLTALEQAGQLASTDPELFSRYLERWGVTA